MDGSGVFFVSQSGKISYVKNPLVFQKISDTEKLFGEGGGGNITLFRQKFFVSQFRKVVEQLFSVSPVSRMEKVYA